MKIYDFLKRKFNIEIPYEYIKTDDCGNIIELLYSGYNAYWYYKNNKPTIKRKRRSPGKAGPTTSKFRR